MEGYEFLASVDLPADFPGSAPAISLQLRSVPSSRVEQPCGDAAAPRRYGPADLPWSPGWGAEEMAQRLAAFLHEQAAQVLGEEDLY